MDQQQLPLLLEGAHEEQSVKGEDMVPDVLAIALLGKEALDQSRKEAHEYSKQHSLRWQNSGNHLHDCSSENG